MSLICKICLEEYNNSFNSAKTPRILNCGDTFCTQCLKNMRKNNKIECPICRKEIFEEIEKITVNKVIIDLINDKILSSIKYLDNQDIKADSPDYKFSIALMGESGGGKTSIGKFYRTGEKAQNSELLTVGLDNSFKFLSVHQKTVKITLWDTSGEERYRSISIGYLRGVHAIILVFALTNLLTKKDKEEFGQKSENEKTKIKEEYTKKIIKDLDFWMQQFKQINSQKKQIIYLVGNKIDLGKEYILIKEDEITKFILDNNLKYYETSAVTGEKIQEMFNELAFELMTIYSNSSDASTAKSFKLKNNINKSSKCGC
jgi:small GTP-binding protein